LPAHREIFEAFLEVDRRGSVLDVITVADELKARGMLNRLEGEQLSLLALANAVPTADAVTHYARIVAGHAARRRLIAAAAEIASPPYGDTEFEYLLTDASNKLAALEATGRATKTVQFGSMVSETLESIEKRSTD